MLLVPDEGGLEVLDMKNLTIVHGSPQVFVKLDRTPTMMDGRLEMFGNIGDMIQYWEGVEKKEAEKELTKVTLLVPKASKSQNYDLIYIHFWRLRRAVSRI